MNAVVVDGLSKKFRLQTDKAHSVKELVTRRDRRAGVDEFWALRNVSLEIERGSMFALVGHNGCGKSTLLRCIAGIYQPTEGSVTVDGRVSTLLELGAGFHPDLTGRENIYMNATILGMSKRKIDAVFDDIVAFAGVEEFIDSPVKIYSSGMFIRLGFSVAVHVDPEILIIDEVIAVGDEEFQRRCFDHLYELRQNGVTVVVVSHGLDIVKTMCDRALWLDHGVPQMEGPAPEVAQAYLGAVNAAEADATASSERVAGVGTGSPGSGGRDPITPDGDHWGSGEVRITSVEVLDSSGSPLQVIPQGSALRLRIEFDADVEVEDPTIGIAVHSESGVHITGTNTRLSNLRTGRIRGAGAVDWVTDRLPLLPGSYLMSVAIEDAHSQHTFDRYDMGWRLRIRQNSEQVLHGLVDPGGSWVLS